MGSVNAIFINRCYIANLHKIVISPLPLTRIYLPKMKFGEKKCPAVHLQLVNFTLTDRSNSSTASFVSHNMSEQLENSLPTDPRCICSVEFDLAPINNNKK